MKTFAKAPIALAIAALLAAPYALATGDDANTFGTDVYMNVDVDNQIVVEIKDKARSDILVDLDLKADLDDPNHMSTATVDRKQYSDNLMVNDDKSVNNSSATGTGNGASGNMGVNVVSGGLNSQANDAAISKSGSEGAKNKDAAMIFAKAATYSKQSSSNNLYNNNGTTNAAGTSGSFNGVSGNLGVNMAAGFGNAQHNGMAIAVGQYSSAEATAVGVQTVYDSDLDNDVACGCIANTNTSALVGSFNGVSGNAGINIATGNANLQSNTLSIARSK